MRVCGVLCFASVRYVQRTDSGCSRLAWTRRGVKTAVTMDGKCTAGLVVDTKGLRTVGRTLLGDDAQQCCHPQPMPLGHPAQ